MTHYVHESLNGDSLTPISIYHRLQGDRKFLLESSLKHEKSGRYSFIGASPSTMYRGEKGQLTVKDLLSGATDQFHGDAMTLLKQLLPPPLPEGPFPFSTGAIGYVGYEVLGHTEPTGHPLPKARELPDIYFLWYPTVVVYDHQTHTVTVLNSNGNEDEVAQVVAELQKTPTTELPDEATPLHFTSNITKDEFLANVEKSKEWIYEGEIFQLVLSQRLSASINQTPFAYYRKLRRVNPSPYMFYIDFGDAVVLGASPESFVRVSEGVLQSNPIAGTRPRGATPELDLALEEDLRQDPKERAEHDMLVDLARNDVGRLSKAGSVKVTKYQQVERYQHVMHLVSEVEGQLLPNIHPLEALTACLPAGTVSGAPKIRAMQLINELETTQRGVYAGAVGYLSASGNLDAALAIRTAIISEGSIAIQAGAGIVYDSDPVKEYEETLHKARSLLEVFQ
ncbi:anthranilate synthase component I [Chryseomicrobium aureum]|uniref:anthranilate synthase component I n=1 Tax=Chryseomicrobium aureum TaxID=1441723 RepID=UPI00370D3D0C